MAPAPLCPLCVSPFVCENDSPFRPTADHIPPKSVGGTICALTCKRCNNTHGSALESDMKKAMDVLDFLSGRGTLPAVIENSVGRVSANVDLNDWPRVILNIAGQKASRPDAIENLCRTAPVDRKLSITLSNGFRPAAFWRAVLRLGYMVAFHQFGYAYALSAGGAQVREALSGGDLLDNVIISAYPSGDLKFRFSCLPWTIFSRGTESSCCSEFRASGRDGSL